MVEILTVKTVYMKTTKCLESQNVITYSKRVLIDYMTTLLR